MRKLALQLYMEGNSERAIARLLKTGQQTVANWVDAYVDKLPSIPEPEQPLEAELAELYSFLQQCEAKSTSRPLERFLKS
jgi:transposase